MVLISATRLHVRSPLYLPLVLWHSYKSARQASRAAGFLGGKVLRDANLTYWTLTAWHDQAGMMRYRNGDAHRRAMLILSLLCDEAAVVRWQQDTADLPDWDSVHQRMVNEGRFSPIAQPSSAQIDRHIPTPVVDRFAAEMAIAPHSAQAELPAPSCRA